MQLDPPLPLRRTPPAGPGEILRLFLTSAGVYTASALILGAVLAARDALVVEPVAWSARWLHVHLALAMGITQAIIGATQFFAAAFLAVAPPPRPLIRSQWVLANAGALIMLGGGLYQLMWVVGLGGSLVLAAMALLLWSLWQMKRQSLMGLDLNLLFYLTAVGFVILGMTFGVLMALNLTWPFFRPDVRLAHMHYNLLGFVTLTIVGTMHTFFPTVAGIKLHSWRLAGWTYWLLAGGTLVMGTGFLVGWTPAIVLGGVAEVMGSAAFTYNIWRTRRGAAGLPLPARHLYAAAWFLLITNLAGVALVGTSVSPGALSALTHLALVGFIGQTLLGAMLHLVPVMLGVYGGPTARQRMQPIVAYGGTVQVWLLNGGSLFWAAAAAAAARQPAAAATWDLIGLVGSTVMSAGLFMAVAKGVGCFLAARRA